MYLGSVQRVAQGRDAREHLLHSLLEGHDGVVAALPQQEPLQQHSVSRFVRMTEEQKFLPWLWWWSGSPSMDMTRESRLQFVLG